MMCTHSLSPHVRCCSSASNHFLFSSVSVDHSFSRLLQLALSGASIGFFPLPIWQNNIITSGEKKWRRSEEWMPTDETCQIECDSATFYYHWRGEYMRWHEDLRVELKLIAKTYRWNDSLRDDGFFPHCCSKMRRKSSEKCVCSNGRRSQSFLSATISSTAYHRWRRRIEDFHRSPHFCHRRYCWFIWLG